MKNKYYIKKLWFTGPEIEDSPIEFINGLNIIHGANDTGKSWILDSFDFMCGMDYDNFVIDKSTGCDTVHMEVVTGQKVRILGSRHISIRPENQNTGLIQYG